MIDFEKVLVFVRCVNSILTPDFVFPCYRYGRWNWTLEYAHQLSFLPRFHVMSICLSFSQVVVLPLVSMFVVHVSKFRLFRSRACLSNRLWMHVCVSACPFGLWTSGMRSTTLAVGLVLRSATDAVQLSKMLRILPQSVGARRLLVSGSIVLWPSYPQIASGTLDAIFWIEANYVRTWMEFQCSVISSF